MYSAASSTRSRTSSALSMRGSIGEITPTKMRWSGLAVVADDSQHAHRIGLAAEGDVEVGHIELEQAGQELGVVDVGAVRRVAVAAGAGVDADPLAFLGREARQREIVEIDEAAQQPPEGSSLTARRPSVKSIWTLCAPCSRQRAHLALVLAQQVSMNRSRG